MTSSSAPRRPRQPRGRLLAVRVLDDESASASPCATLQSRSAAAAGRRCGRGGTGRRARFRSWCEGVGVRVPPPASSGQGLPTGPEREAARMGQPVVHFRDHREGRRWPPALLRRAVRLGDERRQPDALRHRVARGQRSRGGNRTSAEALARHAEGYEGHVTVYVEVPDVEAALGEGRSTSVASGRWDPGHGLCRHGPVRRSRRAHGRRGAVRVVADRVLHLTNGDATVPALRDAGAAGDVLAWRDVLHDGPVAARTRRRCATCATLPRRVRRRRGGGRR